MKPHETRRQHRAKLSVRNGMSMQALLGLNTGASGQAQLSFSNLLQSNLANTDRAQADALSQLDLQSTQLQTQYKNDVAKAIADGDFAKAQSLYNNFQTERDRLIQQQQYPVKPIV